MSEVQDAVQILRITLEGVDIMVKVTGASLSTVKKSVAFLAALLIKEKNMGKTNVRKLLQRGGDIQVFQFQSKDLAKVEKMAKKYGILYSVLPDINQKDGMSEILFHTEAVPRVNMLIQKLKSGKITSFEDYLNNGEEAEIKKVTKELAPINQNMPMKEVTEEKKDVVTRIDGIHAGQDKDLSEITVLRYQVREETDRKLKIRLPFIEEEYIWVDKNKVFQLEDGRSFSIYLNRNIDYHIYSRENQIVGSLSGKQLFEKYFDKKNERIKEAVTKAGVDIIKKANRVR